MRNADGKEIWVCLSAFERIKVQSNAFKCSEM